MSEEEQQQEQQDVYVEEEDDDFNPEDEGADSDNCELYSPQLEVNILTSCS